MQVGVGQRLSKDVIYDLGPVSHAKGAKDAMAEEGGGMGIMGNESFLLDPAVNGSVA